MFLSDEQQGAVDHGRDRSVSWRPAMLPIGAVSIPGWAKDLHVEFHDGYGNAPSYVVKAAGDLRRWEGKRFSREGSRFMARHEDGRAEVYYQDGPLSPAALKRFRTLDGRLHAYRPQTGARVEERNSKGEVVLSHVPYDDGDWVEVERLCTPQQDGFGGAHIDITLVDGTEVTLRGPWHGGAPEGFAEASYVDVTSNYYAAYTNRPRKTAGPRWRRLGGTGGLFLSHDLFRTLIARFQPHLQLLAVTMDGRMRLEAVKPEWDCPKAVWMQRERVAHIGRALALLAQQRTPVAAVYERDHDLAPWALNELVRRGHATSEGPWDKARYQITEAGRLAAQEEAR